MSFRSLHFFAFLILGLTVLPSVATAEVSCLTLITRVISRLTSSPYRPENVVTLDQIVIDTGVKKIRPKNNLPIDPKEVIIDTSTPPASDGISGNSLDAYSSAVLNHVSY